MAAKTKPGDICDEVLANFIHGLKLIHQNTGESAFELGIEVLENLVDHHPVLQLVALLEKRVGPFFGPSQKQFVVSGTKTILLAMLARHGPGKVPHDCPGGVCRKLVAASVIELLDRTDQRQVPVADHLEEVHPGAKVLLRNRDHQPEIAANQEVLHRLALFQQRLDLIHGRSTVTTCAPPAQQRRSHVDGLPPQEIHFPEVILLLLTSQDRQLVQRGQVSWQSGWRFGQPGFAGAPGSAR